MIPGLIEMKLEVPYPMTPAMDEPTRERHMAWSVSQGYPRIKYRAMTNQVMQIIAYGPSLEDTWRDINPEKPLLTMSGALRFLLERGLKPKWGRWFHVEVDPRPHKIKMLERHEEVIYLIGSCAHPELFKYLEGTHVVLFHARSGPHTKTWIERNDPGQVLVCAGSTVGLTAIHVGGVFGYRHFEIHGMDGSFRGDARHCGPHTGIIHGQRPSQLNPVYMTSRMMENTNFEIKVMLHNFPLFAIFHGDGVVQDWVGKANLPNAARAGSEHARQVRASMFEEVSVDTARELYEAGVPLMNEAYA